jgi:hypothetical protein
MILNHFKDNSEIETEMLLRLFLINPVRARIFAFYSLKVIQKTIKPR